MSYYAYDQYTGNGELVNFSITFPYIYKTHVKVYVQGVLKTHNLHYTFLNASTIQFNTAPLDGEIVAIQRQSNRNARLVDYTTGSILKEATLDMDSNQLFYLMQEAFDMLTQTTNESGEMFTTPEAILSAITGNVDVQHLVASLNSPIGYWNQIHNHDAIYEFNEDGTSVYEHGTMGDEEARISLAEHNITLLVADTEGNAAAIAVNAEDISLNVTDIAGHTSQLALMADEFYVKLDDNGNVCGFGLYNGETSAFIVNVDYFAVIKSDGTGTQYPFIIDTESGLVAIDGNLLVTGSITAAKIAADAIEASHILAHEITADKLRFGINPNLLASKWSDFECFEDEDVIGIVVNGTALAETSDFMVGETCLKMTATDDDNYVYLGTSETDYNVRMKPSTKYILSYYAKAATGTPNMQAYVKQDDGAHKETTSQDITTDWERYQFILTTDANLTNSGIIRLDNNDDGAVIYIDAIQLEEAPAGDNPVASMYHSGAVTSVGGGQILPGTITGTEIDENAISTPHLLANCITGVKILAGEIDTDHLAALSVSTGKLQVGSVTETIIGDGAITTQKVHANAITATHIGTNEIIANAANIKNAIITGAKIGNAEVDSLQIQGNAVTIPVGAYTAGSMTIDAPAEETVQTAALTSSGAPIHISGAVTLRLVDEGSPPVATYNVRIYRDTTVIYFATLDLRNTYFTWAAAISDTPGSGSVTYRIKIQPSGSTSYIYVSCRSLLLLETKR